MSSGASHEDGSVGAHALAVTELTEEAVAPAHDAVVREQRTGVAAAGGDLELDAPPSE